MLMFYKNIDKNDSDSAVIYNNVNDKINMSVFAKLKM